MDGEKQPEQKKIHFRIQRSFGCASIDSAVKRARISKLFNSPKKREKDEKEPFFAIPQINVLIKIAVAHICDLLRLNYMVCLFVTLAEPFHYINTHFSIRFELYDDR